MSAELATTLAVLNRLRPPKKIDFNTSGTFNPADYPGFAYIDVDVWNGGGGGGGNGYSVSPTAGGQGGSSAFGSFVVSPAGGGGGGGAAGNVVSTPMPGTTGSGGGGGMSTTNTTAPVYSPAGSPASLYLDGTSGVQFGGPAGGGSTGGGSTLVVYPVTGGNGSYGGGGGGGASTQYNAGNGGYAEEGGGGGGGAGYAPGTSLVSTEAKRIGGNGGNSISGGAGGGGGCGFDARMKGGTSYSGVGNMILTNDGKVYDLTWWNNVAAAFPGETFTAIAMRMNASYACGVTAAGLIRMWALSSSFNATPSVWNYNIPAISSITDAKDVVPAQIYMSTSAQYGEAFIVLRASGAVVSFVGQSSGGTKQLNVPSVLSSGVKQIASTCSGATSTNYGIALKTDGTIIVWDLDVANTTTYFTITAPSAGKYVSIGGALANPVASNTYNGFAAVTATGQVHVYNGTGVTTGVEAVISTTLTAGTNFVDAVYFCDGSSHYAVAALTSDGTVYANLVGSTTAYPVTGLSSTVSRITRLYGGGTYGFTLALNNGTVAFVPLSTTASWPANATFSNELRYDANTRPKGGVSMRGGNGGAGGCMGYPAQAGSTPGGGGGGSWNGIQFLGNAGGGGGGHGRRRIYASELAGSVPVTVGAGGTGGGSGATAGGAGGSGRVSVVVNYY